MASKKKVVKKATKKPVKKHLPVKKVLPQKDQIGCIKALEDQVAVLKKRCDDLESTCADLEKKITDTFVGEIREPKISTPTSPEVSIPTSPFMKSINASPIPMEQSNAIPKSWGAFRS